MTRDVEPLLINWWKAKNEAVARLAADGRSDTGAQARDSRHMQSIAMFVKQMFVDAGLDEPDVKVDSIIPGYYRRSKNWDVVATHKGHLVGVVELKSQASSPGNNANNRIEEAIGSAVDVKAVQEETGAFGKLGVWAAWCMTFNRDAESGDPIQLTRMQKAKIRFPLDDLAFKNMTYAYQYAIALERLIARKVYDAGWMVLTWVNDDGTVDYVEPIPTATAETLAIKIEERVKFAIQALREE
ncbi:PaeR7I family type II restriction endonuclease [Amycolatopsis thailandensis]|uniref:PaeR7I family type II restriction endonuclease n=1 Tax=Amycolatopsis thailandensis TaxID=589330 RepID=UPI00365F5634